MSLVHKIPLAKHVCLVYNNSKRGDCMSDKQLVDAIKRILAKGNNVEIKKSADGNIAVFEVKKNKIIS